MLNSAEHEIFSANKYESGIFILLAEKISCLSMFSNKELAIISYLRFISITNFMLSWVEHEKMFIISAPDAAPIKNLCSVRIGVLYHICETYQWNTYNQKHCNETKQRA